MNEMPTTARYSKAIVLMLSSVDLGENPKWLSSLLNNPDGKAKCARLRIVSQAWRRLG